MAPTYYAWTEIRGGTLEKPINLNRGEKVSASILAISELDFKAMIDSGAVRVKKYPVPDDYKGSAVDYLRDQLREATTVSDLDEAEAVSELSALEKASEHQ